jgi:hypothetical protein
MVAIGGIGLIALTESAGYNKQFGGIFGTDQFATFILAATVGSFLVEVVYVLLAIVAVKLVLEEGGAGLWWKLIVLLVAVATPLLGFKGALWPDPHNSSNYNWVALYWTLGVIALAAVWLVLCLVLRPTQVRDAARHGLVDDHSGVPALEDPMRI